MKRSITTSSIVEQQFLEKSNRSFMYPGEHIPSIEVSNCLELGKLTALRLIEWILGHPAGVISLPTGKTPEFFIKFFKHYKENWHKPAVQQELQSYGIVHKTFPDTSKLKFVQIDEFYPIDPEHQNSFYRYINTHYLPLLEIRTENQLLINPAQVDDVNTFCTRYEKQINDWGGIGFFLGGIGPEGHIAFNMCGSAHNSTTRIVQLNYESAACASSSLGGMEFARDKTALTIGLDTITRNKDATIIIIAAGQGKAPVVTNAIEQEKNNIYPATALHGMPGARFYITHGAASQLHARYLEDIARLPSLESAPETVDEILATIALELKKPIKTLTEDDLKNDPVGKLLLQKAGKNIDALIKQSAARFVQKIEDSLHNISKQSILHTAPHHDDVMLSYHPVAVGLLDNNKNYFAYATSGFTAVTNLYLIQMLEQLTPEFIRSHENALFNQSYQDAIELFAQAFAQDDIEMMTIAKCLIFAHKVREVFNCTTLQELQNKIAWMHNEYLPAIRPGEKDQLEIQQLKGAIRESEVDRMWQIHKVLPTHVFHLRSQFYTGDYFTPQPTFQYDVQPVIDMFEQFQPQLITVAFDPEGTGPDTHYKVLQMVAQALEHWHKDGNNPTVWGYRNVWYRFKPSETNLIIPVSSHELEYLDDIFLACFSTQKEASFPSHQFDGPFSKLSVQIQKEQLQTMCTLLGNDFFDSHPDERIRNAAGLLFLKQMDTKTFLDNAQALKKQTEVIFE